MPININVERHSQSGVRCIYNSDEISATTLGPLLENNAQALIAEGSELICETSNSRSYRIAVNGRAFFAKEYKPQKWYRRVWGQVYPPSFASFRAGTRLLKADLPTPLPILAAAVCHGGSEPRQLLVTEFLEKAQGLNQAIVQLKNSKRMQLIDQLASLLAEFHCKGFYSRHLRSANILLTDKSAGQRDAGTPLGYPQKNFWFIDLDRLSSNRFLTGTVFVSTVTRACSEFYEKIPPSDRHHLLRACFDAALKQNIYHKPSLHKWFTKKAAAQIKQRQ